MPRFNSRLGTLEIKIHLCNHVCEFISTKYVHLIKCESVNLFHMHFFFYYYTRFFYYTWILFSMTMKYISVICNFYTRIIGNQLFLLDPKHFFRSVILWYTVYETLIFRIVVTIIISFYFFYGNYRHLYILIL